MNNGITLHGLVINNGKCNISPTIYLDYYYKEFENGADIDKLAKQVIAQYKKFELDEDFDISVFTDYEKCKNNISFKLINYEKNKEPYGRCKRDTRRQSYGNSSRRGAIRPDYVCPHQQA